MAKEYLNKGPEPEMTKDNTAADNLQFMRLAIEKARRDFDPGVPIFIMWGLICLIGYTATHFLIVQQAYTKINTVWLSLYAIGIPWSMFFGYRIARHQETHGIVPHIYIQIGLIWGITVISGIIFGTFGFGRSFISNINFLWAWIYAISLSMTGIVYSKEWLWGGIGVLAGMLAAASLEQYTYLILACTMCTGCVIPALITRKRLKDVEKENAQV